MNSLVPYSLAAVRSAAAAAAWSRPRGGARSARHYQGPGYSKDNSVDRWWCTGVGTVSVGVRVEKRQGCARGVVVGRTSRVASVHQWALEWVTTEVEKKHSSIGGRHGIMGAESDSAQEEKGGDRIARGGITAKQRREDRAQGWSADRQLVACRRENKAADGTCWSDTWGNFEDERVATAMLWWFRPLVC